MSACRPKSLKVVIKYSHRATRRRIRSDRTDGARPRVRNDPRERVPLGTKRWSGSPAPENGREITLPVVAAGSPAMLRCTIYGIVPAILQGDYECMCRAPCRGAVLSASKAKEGERYGREDHRHRRGYDVDAHDAF